LILTNNQQNFTKFISEHSVFDIFWNQDKIFIVVMFYFSSSNISIRIVSAISVSQRQISVPSFRALVGYDIWGQ